MTPGPLQQARRRHDLSGRLRELGWYHSFAFPDGSEVEGVQSLPHQLGRFNRFPLPASLEGKMVLDIGAWDGWFSFEAEKRGARVTAVDCVDIPNFRLAHKKLQSSVDYRILNLYDLPRAGLPRFDVVFFLGVLYHLKHPLLALEIVCSLTSSVAVIESFVIDGPEWQAGRRQEIPTLEFYETDELGGHLDNWFGPSVASLAAMCRAAGFARVELLHVADSSAMVAGFRTWPPVDQTCQDPPPELAAAVNNLTGGINVATGRDQYLTWWFSSTALKLTREDLMFEVDGLGCHAVSLTRYPEANWSANTILPPGLSPGWKEARMRTTHSPFSRPVRLAVDMPAAAEKLELIAAKDGSNWIENRLESGPEAYLALWVKGLPPNADIANVAAYLSGEPLQTVFVSEEDENGARQINVRPAAALIEGSHDLYVQIGNTRSNALRITVSPPAGVSGR